MYIIKQQKSCDLDIDYLGIDVNHVCAAPNTEYNENGTTAQRAFSFKISADSIENTAMIIKYIQGKVKLIDKNGNNMLLDPFDTNRIIRN